MHLGASFKLAGTYVEQTKFDQLVVLLDAVALSFASDIFCTSPEYPYNDLKTRLLSELEVSQNRKVKSLLEDLELGVKFPSILLRKMRELNGSLVDDDFLKNIRFSGYRCWCKQFCRSIMRV